MKPLFEIGDVVSIDGQTGFYRVLSGKPEVIGPGGWKLDGPYADKACTKRIPQDLSKFEPVSRAQRKEPA